MPSTVFTADPFRRRQPAWLPGWRLARLLAWLLAAALVLQLLGATQHHHAIDAQLPDCSACFVASLPPAGQPFQAPVPQACAWTLRYILAQAAVPSGPVLAAFLIPQAHGPPPLLCRH